MKFIDVPETHWASEAINKLANNKILKGYEDSTFRPENSATRAECVIVLTRMHKDYDSKKKYQTPPFVDVLKNAWYINELGFAYEKGFIKGFSDGTFKPDDFITRAEFAVMVSRYMEG